MKTLEGDEKINIIQKQQNCCSDFVDPLTSENIKTLLEGNDFYFEYSDNGKLLASAYKKPLDKELFKEDRNQVYRLGGLSRDKFEAFSEKALLKVFHKAMEDINKKNLKVITGTTNPVIMKFLIRNGFTKLSYNELKQKFPKILQLFLEDDERNSEDFHNEGYIFIKNIV